MNDIVTVHPAPVFAPQHARTRDKRLNGNLAIWCRSWAGHLDSINIILSRTAGRVNRNNLTPTVFFARCSASCQLECVRASGRISGRHIFNLE